MLTDDEVRDRLVSDLHAALDPVSTPPSLLRDVHTQQLRRRAAATASLAVALLAVLVAALAWPSGETPDRLAVTPSPRPQPTGTPVIRIVPDGPVIPSNPATRRTVFHLFEYTFQSPPGFVVTQKGSGVRAVNGRGSSFQISLQNVDRYPLGEQRPAWADSYRRITIGGHPATEAMRASGGPECLLPGTGRTLVKVHEAGACGHEVLNLEIIPRPNEVMFVQSLDVDQTAIRQMLEEGLR